MRVFRPFLVVVALVAFGSATAAGASRDQHCTIPHAWRLVAQDRQLVVIAKRHNYPYSDYDYCNRAVGERRSLTAGPTGLRLKGRYVAAWPLSAEAGLVSLWDTRSGNHNEVVVSGSPVVTTLLLSPSGVAAWIVFGPNGNPEEFGGPIASVAVLTLHNEEVLDSANFWGSNGAPVYPPVLGNLQLYNCAAGCAPDTTVVAWTHSGEPRYAQVMR